jgi:5-formyltetrahydrofolate cyclo-ligase
MALRAQQFILMLPEYVSAGTVALYSPVHGEVDTALLASDALQTGKSVLFPAVTQEGLEFRRITDPDDFAPGRFGIREPKSGCTVYDPLLIDFFIIPGVAFDLSCRRVGYGKGYYDRVLHQLEKSGRLAGFCYDFQLVDEIPAAPHDVEMDMVITDRRVVRSSGQFT